MGHARRAAYSLRGMFLRIRGGAVACTVLVHGASHGTNVVLGDGRRPSPVPHCAAVAGAPGWVTSAGGSAWSRPLFRKGTPWRIHSGSGAPLRW